MRTAANLAALVVLTGASGAAAAPFSCPATLDAGGQPHKFKYVSFFDGDPADLADLAPDDRSTSPKLDQTWRFERQQGRPIVMVCRYHGTQETVRKDVPASIKECRLEGTIDDKGEIQGSPKLTCK